MLVYLESNCRDREKRMCDGFCACNKDSAPDIIAQRQRDAALVYFGISEMRQEVEREIARLEKIAAGK